MKPLKSVFLTINSEVREFSSKEEALKYFDSEERDWKWLTELPSLYRDAGVEIFSGFFKNALGIARESLVKGDKKVYLGSSGVYVESSSAEGVLIRRFREQYGDVAAALALIYLNESTRKAIGNSSIIKKFVDNPSLAFERAAAIQIGLSLQDFIAMAWDARSSNLRNQLERFSEHTALARNAVNGYAADLTEEIIASKTKVDSLGRALGKSYIRRRKIYSQYAAKARQEAKASVLEAKTALESAKAAYHDQVDLDASVQYWTARRKTHSFFKFTWFLAIILSMSVTFLSMLAYYGYGGAAGLSHLLREQGPAEAAVQLAAASDSAPKILLGRSSSELSAAVADLAGAALLITLLGVLIKITLRQFNTHSHLSLEAAERITFTKTYLALLNEGKLKSDEDRKLILESLFRSTQSGSVAEIPFSSPIELILKTLGEKKVS
ncbi:DUF6161 domain-containing protein [Pseudomonas kilonensis]|uniref:DUF6161 domain-containing protein n=1 Tax=Pseudomonas kilonensis TaxID=132476 RepID=UPI000427E43B|nr:DUF6161 domain-containing protein [Pseudomonas kilonensis]